MGICEVNKPLVTYCVWNGEGNDYANTKSESHQPLCSGGGGFHFLCWLGLVSPLCMPLKFIHRLEHPQGHLLLQSALSAELFDQGDGFSLYRHRTADAILLFFVPTRFLLV